MAEHSICQPGRPFPQGEGHAGSPGFAAFPEAEVHRILFYSGFGVAYALARAGLQFLQRLVGELAVPAESLRARK